jgi:hypothetical protein
MNGKIIPFIFMIWHGTQWNAMDREKLLVVGWSWMHGGGGSVSDRGGVKLPPNDPHEPTGAPSRPRRAPRAPRTHEGPAGRRQQRHHSYIGGERNNKYGGAHVSHSNFHPVRIPDAVGVPAWNCGNNESRRRAPTGCSRRIATNSMILSVTDIRPSWRTRCPALCQSQADDKAALTFPQEGQLDVV